MYIWYTGYREAVIKCHTITNVKTCRRICKEATVILTILIKWEDLARMYNFLLNITLETPNFNYLV